MRAVTLRVSLFAGVLARERAMVASASLENAPLAARAASRDLASSRRTLSLNAVRELLAAVSQATARMRAY